MLLAKYKSYPRKIVNQKVLNVTTVNKLWFLPTGKTIPTEHSGHELKCCQSCVDTAVCHQRCMRTLLHDLPMVQHHDAIGFWTVAADVR